MHFKEGYFGCHVSCNRSGKISLQELENFLFAQEEGKFESGMLIDLARKALVQLSSGAAALGTDEALLAEFAKLGKVSCQVCLLGKSRLIV